MKIFFKTPGGWQFLWERKLLEMDKFRLLCGIAVAMIVAVFFVTLIVAVIWR